MTAMDKILMVNSSKWTETNLLSLFMFETNVLFFSPPIIRAASPQRNDAERGRYRQHLHAKRHYLCQQCLPVAQSSRWICLRTVHHLSAIWCGCKDFKQSCKTLGDFFSQPKIFSSTTADDMDRITIENGMKDIGSGTCVKFVPRTHEASFLDIQPRYGWVHVSVFGRCFLFSAFDILMMTHHFCSTPQAAGHFWGRLEEARPCRCRLLAACGQGWLHMN